MTTQNFIDFYVELLDMNQKISKYGFNSGSSDDSYVKTLASYNRAIMDMATSCYVNRYGNAENGGYIVRNVVLQEHVCVPNV